PIGSDTSALCSASRLSHFLRSSWRRGLERRSTSNSGPSSHIVSRTGFGSTWRAERPGSSRMDFARESTTLSGWVLDRRQRRLRWDELERVFHALLSSGLQLASSLSAIPSLTERAAGLSCER